MTRGDKQKLGTLLQTLRLERKLSITELAATAGLSKGYLSQLERGDANNPSVDALRKLSEALGVPFVEVLGVEKEANSGMAGLPRSLQAFAEAEKGRGRPISHKDLEMLSRVQYRGRYPEKPEDWAYLYETIKRIIK